MPIMLSDLPPGRSWRLRARQPVVQISGPSPGQQRYGMNLLRRRHETASGRRSLLEELEGLLKRIRVIPLAAPILIVAGFGLGKVTTRALELPASAAVHDPLHAREVPRGQIDELTQSMTELRMDGAKTVDFVTVYRNHVLPVEQV